jgi:tRNA (guanine-N7-)-methyltransferase
MLSSFGHKIFHGCNFTMAKKSCNLIAKYLYSPMGRQKMQRRIEAPDLPNVFDESAAQWRGRWKQDIFGNHNSLTLELGCGKGEFSLEMARRYPDRNFIGVEYKSYILWQAGTAGISNDLANAKFLRIRIQEICNYLAPHEVDEIWFVFPDPFPKNRHIKHRLIFPAFLPLYKNILTPNGTLHFKTDCRMLFEYANEVLNEQGIRIDESLSYREMGGSDDYQIATTYERKFLKGDEQIYYLRFRFPDEK